MIRRAARVLFGGMLLALATSLAACGDKVDDGTAPGAKEELPPLRFEESTPNLMLTWIDARGSTHVEVSPNDVPAEGRQLVRVLVADKDAGAKDPIYVANLDERDGGSFVAKSFSRQAWEGEIAKKRDVHIAKLAPPKPPPVEPPPAGSGSPGAPPADPPLDVPSGVTVIIYGADWCKPCHQAADWLKSRGVPAIVKDIDKSPEAEAEMVAKLQKAGMRRGSIPVIDVAGKILVGYNERQLAQALAASKSGTML